MRQSVCVSADLVPAQRCLPSSVTVRCAGGPATRVDVVVATRDPARNLRARTKRILTPLQVVVLVRTRRCW